MQCTSSDHETEAEVIWPYEVSRLTQEEIAVYTKAQSWQAFRKTLKGQSTQAKVNELKYYLRRSPDIRSVHVRVDNYINALLRGGQLMRNAQGKIILGDRP